LAVKGSIARRRTGTLYRQNVRSWAGV